VSARSESWAGFLILAVAVLLLLARGALLARGPLAIGAQILAVLLMLWARLTFGTRSFHAAADPTEGGLVTTGPYRLLRHPIYAAVLLFLVAGVASHRSLPGAACLLVAVLGTALRIGAEERLMTLRYPEYKTYAKRTRRLIPFVF
jgi:protein-S-isoprenylcysteine O-methyltransferase Ste14